MKVLLLTSFLFFAPLCGAQTTFEYLPGYPQSCGDTGPADVSIGSTYTFGNNSICQIPTVTHPILGVPYADANFGHTVRTVAPIGYYHTYSTPSALSATGKYVATHGLDEQYGGDSISGTTDIWDTTTGVRVKKTAGASQDWGFYWHPTQDGVYFSISGSAIYRRSVIGTDNIKVFEDLAGIITGGTGDLSMDLWFAYATSRDQVNGKICTAPLDESNRKYCISQAGLFPPGTAFDFALPSKGKDLITGQRYVVLEQGGTILAVDEQSRGLVKVGNGPAEVHWNHSDTMQGPDGRQYLFGTHDVAGKPWPAVPGGSRPTFWLLADPSVFYSTFQISWGSPVVAGAGSTHYNCAKTAPVCAVGYSANATVDGVIGLAPYQNEVMTIEMTNPGAFTVKRLATNQTRRFTDYSQDYDSMPMCGISGDGRSRVAFKTNWGLKPIGYHAAGVDNGGTRQETVIDLVPSSVPPSPPPPVVQIIYTATSPLPQGVTLTPQGALTVDPTIIVPGDYSFEIESIILDGSATPGKKVFTLHVKPKPAPPPPLPVITITTASRLPDVTVGDIPYTIQLEVLIG